MMKYSYTNEVNQFLNNINENSDIKLKAIRNIAYVQNQNVSILYNAVESLQKENLLLKQILREVIVNEDFKYIKENESFKNF